jgi:hypothetical protein
VKKNIEVGQRYRNRNSGLNAIWVVERLMNTPGNITHVTIVREDAPGDSKTYSVKALQDQSTFEPVPAAG